MVELLDVDMRSYRFNKKQSHELVVPPEQETELCDICGGLVSTVSMVSCPYCDTDVCGTCFHYCKSTIDKSLCAYSQCRNRTSWGRMYCCRRCTGMGIQERYHS